jgi:radical SAM superfamily enzyme YgiQ (UPF0313 family)
MRVLLVSPRTPNTFWSFHHVIRFIHRRSSLPPLGLLTVAAMLPRHWELELVDLDVHELHDQQIRRADWVLIGAMLVHLESVREVATRCRALGKPVIGGGPLFTADEPAPEGIDHVVLGEAEEIIDQIVSDMEAGTVRALYQAGAYPDITRTPIPRWDLIKLRHYATMAVQFTRGCPYDCEFCDIVALNGRVPRVKRPQQLIAELESLRLRGWEGATFLVDDNFIGNKRKVKALLRDMIGWRRDTGSRMTFLTEASVNMAADPELLDLMVAAGFKKVFLGIETPDPESLRACHKLHNANCDLVESVHTIQRAGLEVMGGFIVGFDSDQPDIFERQFEFIQQAGVVTAMVGLLQAVPRSRLYQRLAREGRLLGDSLGDNTKAAFNFEPKLDRDFLVSNYRRLMERLYEPSAYYQRIRAFLNEHRSLGPRRAPTPAEYSALLRAFWVIGVASRGRRAYWRFCASTLLKHPNQFGLAITLAIYGHHFRQVSRGL